MTSLLLAAALGFQQPAPLKYTLKENTRTFAKAEFNLTRFKDGSLRHRWVVSEIGGDKKSSFTDEMIWDAAARPKVFKRVMNEGGGVTTITGLFFDNRVEVTFQSNGLREMETHPAPTKHSTVNPATYWFVDSKPKVGARATVAEFDFENMEWVVISIIYKGVEKLTVGGRTVNAHRIDRGSDETVWVDDQARPIRQQERDAGTLITLERI